MLSVSLSRSQSAHTSRWKVAFM